MTKFVNNVVKGKVPRHIKNKMNVRNRLLKLRKKRLSPEIKSRITNGQENGTSPPSRLLIENRLYMSPDSHMKQLQL